jgi:predicted nucleic acid-binding protein
VARLIMLDAGPLGLATRNPGIPQTRQCLAWLRALEVSGAVFAIPEIADYEVRRELIRTGAMAALRRRDALKATLDYRPITTSAMLPAADLWANVRKQGIPTAAPDALDADCILAGQALIAGQPGDTVTVATNNIKHLGRFPGIDAREWLTIT